MFYNQYINNKINRLHERALQIVYNDYESSFEQLLIIKDNSFCTHHQDIHRLMIQIHKMLILHMTHVYNDFVLRSSHDFSL